jgi:flavin reductase (DIM6/NTAB) family NADH-FMN oxidoreductase RutF
MSSHEAAVNAPKGDDPDASGQARIWPGLTAEEFKLAFRNHPAGVAVVIADAGDGPVGLTATSVFSVSAEPPLLVFSISALASSASTLARADTVVVHLLGADQLPVAKLFATSGVDRFADRGSWSRLATGEPYLLSAHSWLRGRIINRMEAGGSTVIAVHALEAHTPEQPSSPLVYHNRSWHGLDDHSRLER